MKIQNTPSNVSGLDTTRTDRVDLKGQGKKVGGVQREEIKSAARVDLSPRAQELKKIKDLAMATPDVDVEKVAKFQKLIDEGKYKVDAKSVADRMVDEHLMFGEEN